MIDSIKLPRKRELSIIRISNLSSPNKGCPNDKLRVNMKIYKMQIRYVRDGFTRGFSHSQSHSQSAGTSQGIITIHKSHGVRNNFIFIFL